MNLASAVFAFVVFAATVLPSGWNLAPPPGPIVTTGTMPQGMALSPTGTVLAVVEAGYTKPALALFSASPLKLIRSVALDDAFGRPAWLDASHVLVAGANKDALYVIDARTGATRTVALRAHDDPVAAIVLRGGRVAIGCDGSGGVMRVGTLDTIRDAAAIPVGGHVGGLAETPDRATVFASNQSGSTVTVWNERTKLSQKIATGLHPGALLVVGNKLYIAQTDADALGVYDLATGTTRANIYVGSDNGIGASPNALFARGSDVLVSLGAANAIALVRNDVVVGRAPAGRYPTDLVATETDAFVLDGKGEGTQPNPGYTQHDKESQYIGRIETGSLREVAYPTSGERVSEGATGWDNGAPTDTPIRANGPIQHVFFVLKENRSYDQVLGDMPQGDGDPALTWFGSKITPNEHALAMQYGLFDQAYTSGEVSAVGHLWADDAFANDFSERLWGPEYGGRRDDDITSEGPATQPHSGFIWEQAARQHVSFRDYGELIDEPTGGKTPGTTQIPSLRGKFDPDYVGWDLNYSDSDRVAAWTREFRSMVAAGTLPQFEYIWLPNDHTWGSRVGKLTPDAYVATNDRALGEMLETISHSSVWQHSAVFIVEDDAQDGPDHISDQRSPIFVVSPYARGGVNHDHFSTVSVLRTIELILGMKPLSLYDATAMPMYSAFTATAHQSAFDARPPQIDLTQTNAKTAYGARLSARLDFSHEDRVPGAIMRDILAHNH